MPERTLTRSALERRPTDPATSSDGRWLLVAEACFAFLAGAVTLEVVSGANANSPVPSWGELLPIAWPRALRVLWWLVVAGAAGAFRLALRRMGFRTRAVGTALTVGPFVVFAGGIAWGADWATFH